MNNKIETRKILYVLIMSVALISVMISLDAASRPYEYYFFGILFWVVLPYIIVIMVVRGIKSRISNIVVSFVSIAICFYGLFSIIAAIYVDLDPQSSLTFIFTPLWQLAIIALHFLITIVLHKFLGLK